MARYIDADKLFRYVDEQTHLSKGKLAQYIRENHTSNVVEVRHGHWIKSGNEKKCSVCAFVYYGNNDEWNGCPNCLAKMDGKGDT